MSEWTRSTRGFGRFRSMKKSIIGIMGWLALCYAVSAVGAIASITAQSFYGALAQPSWAPPPWVFGPVWTALYTLMAFAAWLVWREGGWRQQRQALCWFLAQLGFNAIWSWVFFVWKRGFWAWIDITVLWFLIVATIVSFQKRSRVAGLLLIPYLLWVSFAWALNFSLWRMNVEILG